MAKSAMARFTLCIPWMPLLVAATAQVNYPLDQQLPPIARVGSPFSFQFAPTTFSGSQELHYSLIGNPSWLSLDDGSRTLTGTPRPSDAGFATFNITATGNDGIAASMPSKLFVATGNAPVVKANLSDTLSTAGQLSGPKTVTLKPSKPFIITFPFDSFDSNGTALSYFAMLSDHTPLPAWIRFDASSRRFTGIAMPTTTPQSMEVLLIASDIPGFAASSLSFTLTTSVHSLVFKPFSQTINATKGQELHITDLRQKLFLDDSVISNTKLQYASAIIPSWLTFDNETLAISGVAPANTASRDLVIVAQDQFADIAEYTIHLLFESELFTGSFENLDVTLGEHFSYSVPRTILARGDETIMIDFAALANYLTFDPSTFTIAGTIPSSFPPQHVECSVTATSANGRSHNTQSFYVDVSSVSTYPLPGAISSSDNQRRIPKATRDGIIAGSVLGGIFIALLLIALAMCLYRKQRDPRIYIGRKHLKNPQKSEISRPMPIPNVWPDNGIELSTEDDVEKGKEIYDPYLESTPETPPKLDIHLTGNHQARNHQARNSATDSIGEVGTRILDIFEESPYGIQNDTSPSQHPHDSMKLATELAKQGSRRSDHFRKHKRRTTTVYQDRIHRSTGLPVHRRITGMGHGRQTYSPSRSNTHFSSSRRPMSTSSCKTRGTSILSITSSTLPQSPLARKNPPTEERCSIRVVPSSRHSSLRDRRTADEKRSAYLRNRASTESPFFSAGFRASSSTYTSPPAFLYEARSTTRTALSSQSCNTTVMPEDSPVEGSKYSVLDDMEHTHPVPALVASSSQEFPGSLRQYRTTHPHTAITPPRNRVGKAYNRPGTTVAGGCSSHHRRTSTRQSLRAYELKASLNDLTGSKVFEKADMSESIYSAEERDIEEAEQQKTVNLSQYTLPPLNLDKVDTTRNKKRNSEGDGKKKDTRDSNKEVKPTSERDPTPYFFLSSNQEHGGKENTSSSYNTGLRTTPVRSEAKRKGRAISTSERYKPRATHHACINEMCKSSCTGQSHTPKKPASYQRNSIKERRSRKSMGSSTPCRQSTGLGGGKGSSNQAQRTPSRPQSSSYPFFDPPSLTSTNARSSSKRPLPCPPTQATNPNPAGMSTVTSANTNTKIKTEEPVAMMRDLSGNLTFYGTDEEPTIEQLDSSSIAFCSHKGTISSTARQSRLASLHLSSQSPPPPKSEKKKTVVAVNSPGGSGGSTVLSFFPQEMPGDGRRERAVQAGREDSGNVGVNMEAEGGEQAKMMWGNLRSVLGKSGKWVGGGYWDGRGKEEKVFI